ncbi:MAG: hypothetical protein HYX37_11020 [Rhizobiales bacterium]|nr:hypothetical protein [Hyphomicrobiales bacterium]
MKQFRLWMSLTGAALLTLVVSAPASAQVYFGAGPGGVGVGIGDPYYNDYGWRHRHHYWGGAYASDCRVIRERIITPSGRVVFRSRQICD